MTYRILASCLLAVSMGCSSTQPQHAEEETVRRKLTFSEFERQVQGNFVVVALRDADSTSGTVARMKNDTLILRNGKDSVIVLAGNIKAMRLLRKAPGPMFTIPFGALIGGTVGGIIGKIGAAKGELLGGVWGFAAGVVAGGIGGYVWSTTAPASSTFEIQSSIVLEIKDKPS